MDAELQVGGQSEPLFRGLEDSQVGVEFMSERPDIADVVDAFEEGAGEFGGDRPDGNALLGDGGQDKEELFRRLGDRGFVKGDFDEKSLRSLLLGDAGVDASRLRDRA